MLGPKEVKTMIELEEEMISAPLSQAKFDLLCQIYSVY